MLPRTTQLARMLKLPHWLYAPQSGDDRNMTRGMLDGFGVGMVEGVRIFIPVLMTRLGADPVSVGLLTSMPAIAGLLLAVPVGMIISRSNNVIPWYAWSRLLLFLSYPIMAILPLFFDAQTAILLMIGVAAIATLPQTSLSLVFNVVMGSIIDTSRRYQLMSLRWSILGVCNGIAVYMAGQYLGSNAPLKSYAVVICGASLFTAFAFLPARRYEVPVERRDTHAPPQSISTALQQIVHYVRNYRAFRLFVICQAVFQSGLTMSVPLFPLHWVRVLHADDNIIGTVSMIQSVTLLIGYMAGSYIATRFKGRVVILWVCSIALGTYPLITALVGTMAPLVFFAAIWGVATAGIELVLLDMLLDSCPPGQVTAVMPAYQLAMFSVSLLAPLIGTLVAQYSNTTIALILAAGLHFCGAALFIFCKIGRTQHQNTRISE
ncbi:MAG: MFS transporter [Chloroflexia bacterium]|nr:MFS transporter [Chloroflexia bacterium]